MMFAGNNYYVMAKKQFYHLLKKTVLVETKQKKRFGFCHFFMSLDVQRDACAI